MGYTLGQFHAYSDAIVTMELEKMAALLDVITVGSRGDGKAVEKMRKALSGG